LSKRETSFESNIRDMAKGAAKSKRAGGGGGARKAKDPNAPKRAMSAFFFWMQENREKLKKPGMGVADVAKAAGHEWGKLTDKSRWEKLAEGDKKRYEKDIAAYKDGTYSK
jgi:hypothetical protein